LQSINTDRQGVAYRHVILLVLFISDVSEEVATQIAKNWCRRQPRCYLTPLPRGPPADIRIRLIFLETRIIGLHFCRR